MQGEFMHRPDLLCRFGFPILAVYIESSTYSAPRTILITFGLPRSASLAGLLASPSALEANVTR
jgi:hypothetical protein